MARIFESPSSALLKPLVRGEPAVLDRMAQKVISAWITKTTLLGLIKNLRREERVRALARNALSRVFQGEPLPLSAVRLFHVDFEIAKLGMPKTDPVVSATIEPVGFFGVSWFGHFGFELVTADATTIRNHAARIRLHPQSVLIWPSYAQSIEWPPPARSLPDDLIALRGYYGEHRDLDVPVPFDESWKLNRR
jgi:hypothetical protein